LHGAAQRVRRSLRPPRPSRRADEALERLVDAVVRASARQPDGSVIVEESALEAGERHLPRLSILQSVTASPFSPPRP